MCQRTPLLFKERNMEESLLQEECGKCSGDDAHVVYNIRRYVKDCGLKSNRSDRNEQHAWRSGFGHKLTERICNITSWKIRNFHSQSCTFRTSVILSDLPFLTDFVFFFFIHICMCLQQHIRHYLTWVAKHLELALEQMGSWYGFDSLPSFSQKKPSRAVLMRHYLLTWEHMRGISTFC